MTDLPYLSGGEQTTINSTITELFPALAFNSGVRPKNADDMENFVKGLTLTENGAKNDFYPLFPLYIRPRGTSRNVFFGNYFCTLDLSVGCTMRKNQFL